MGLNHEPPLVPKKSQPCLTKHLVFYVKATGKDEFFDAGTVHKDEGLRVFGKNETTGEPARRRNNGSKTRKKKRGSCSRDNRDWEWREERSSSGSTSRKRKSAYEQSLPKEGTTLREHGRRYGIRESSRRFLQLEN